MHSSQRLHARYAWCARQQRPTCGCKERAAVLPPHTLPPPAQVVRICDDVPLRHHSVAHCTVRHRHPIACCCTRLPARGYLHSMCPRHRGQLQRTPRPHLVYDQACVCALRGVCRQQAGPRQVVDELVADERLVHAAGCRRGCRSSKPSGKARCRCGWAAQCVEPAPIQGMP